MVSGHPQKEGEGEREGVGGRGKETGKGTKGRGTLPDFTRIDAIVDYTQAALDTVQ